MRLKWSIKARIGTLRLGLGPRGWVWSLEAGGGTEMEEKKEEKKEEEKISHMCESIGYRPLRGRCPKKGKLYLVHYWLPK